MALRPGKDARTRTSRLRSGAPPGHEPQQKRPGHNECHAQKIVEVHSVALAKWQVEDHRVEAVRVEPHDHGSDCDSDDSEHPSQGVRSLALGRMQPALHARITRLREPERSSSTGGRAAVALARGDRSRQRRRRPDRRTRAPECVLTERDAHDLALRGDLEQLALGALDV